MIPHPAHWMEPLPFFCTGSHSFRSHMGLGHSGPTKLYLHNQAPWVQNVGSNASGPTFCLNIAQSTLLSYLGDSSPNLSVKDAEVSETGSTPYWGVNLWRVEPVLNLATFGS